MARALRTVAIVAGSVALAATGIGAIAGASLTIAGLTTASIASMASAPARLGPQSARIKRRRKR